MKRLTALILILVVSRFTPHSYAQQPTAEEDAVTDVDQYVFGTASGALLFVARKDQKENVIFNEFLKRQALDQERSE